MGVFAPFSKIIPYSGKRNCRTNIRQKQLLEEFCKIAILKNFIIFTIYFIKKRFQHKCFPVNNAKMLRKPVLKNICEGLLLMRIIT